MIDAVYPFLGDDVTGLRSSIERLRKFGAGLGQIYVVGPTPVSGRGIVNIYVEDFRKPAHNVMKKIKEAFDATGDDKLLLMNDDFFLMKEVDLEHLPWYYCGELKKYQGGGNRWHVMCENTRQELIKLGYGTKNFGLHLPCVYEKDKFMRIYKRYWAQDDEFSARILYGNIFIGERGVPLEGDVKIWKGDLRDERGVGCCSTARRGTP